MTHMTYDELLHEVPDLALTDSLRPPSMEAAIECAGEG